MIRAACGSLVNGQQKSVSYGQGSTNTSVATALRDAMNADSGYPVTAFLAGSTISVTAKTAGASTNYSLSGGSSTSQPGNFSQPSFTVATSGSALIGGSDGGSTSAATAVYLHTDHLGSTRVCSNSSGASAGTCDYEPFGEIQPGTTCSVPTNFRFAGMEWDANAGPNGLYHTWFRQYDPNQGRWMSADPMSGYADIPQSLNRYAGLLNDPVNLTDPFGLDVFLMIGNCIWRAVVSVATVSIEGGEEGPPGITITLVERVVCEGGLTGDDIATETVDPGDDLINPGEMFLRKCTEERALFLMRSRSRFARRKAWRWVTRRLHHQLGRTWV